MRSFILAVSMFAIVWAAIAYGCGVMILTPYTARARAGAAALALAFACAAVVVFVLVRAPRVAFEPSPVAVATAASAGAAAARASCGHEVPADHVAHGAIDVVRTAARADQLRDGASIAREETVILTGWAADESVRGPLAAACLTVDGRPFAPQRSRYGEPRPDVASAYKRAAAANTGFEIRLEARDLAPGRHDLGVVGVDAAGRAQQLGAPRRITVR